MIPLKIDRPQRRTPLVNFSLIAINIAIALVGSASPAIEEFFGRHLMLWPTEPRIWQFITYQFLHADLMHLLGNMLFLWVFGNAVEDKLGHTGHACFYLSGGVVAALAQAFFVDNPLLGASGAVSAVTGAFFVLFPRTHVRILWVFFIITWFDIPSMWFIAIAFFRDVIFQIAGAGKVAHLAHIGGSVYGLVVAAGLLVVRFLPREPYDLVSMLRQWNRRRQFATATDAGYDPWTGQISESRSPFQKRKIDPAEERRAAELAAMRARIAQALEAHDYDAAVGGYRELISAAPDSVLSRDRQLEIANQLFARGDHPAAADAYRAFLKAYPSGDTTGQVRLMLGLTAARYLNRPDEARPLLTEAAERLSNEADRELARTILEEIGPANS